MPRVLVVDDDRLLREAVSDVLRAAGFEVITARDGLQASEKLASGPFDTVVSDIHMPGLDGVSLLHAIRVAEPDLPVILMTGEPTLDSAVRAIEHGALRYLVKPFAGNELTELVRFAVDKRRAALALPTIDAAIEEGFERAVVTLEMAFQPIVCWSARGTVGYEALARTTEPSLKNPVALFQAAERLGRLHELGRGIRAKVAAKAGSAPNGSTLFVNLHPHDLEDEELFRADAPLSRIAEQIVLEMPEGAPLHDNAALGDRVARLRRLGYRIALDDMGAGYAGLASFAKLEPEVVKLDLALVRGIDSEATKQKLVHAMVTLCREMGRSVIAEGVETHAERQSLVTQGCDLFQGYLFARPGFSFAEVNFQ